MAESPVGKGFPQMPSAGFFRSQIRSFSAALTCKNTRIFALL